MITYPLNPLGINYSYDNEEQPQPVSTLTVSFNLSVRTSQKEYVPIKDNMSCWVNNKYTQISNTGHQNYYSLSVEVPYDRQSLYIVLKHPDFYDRELTYSDYTEITSDITMLSASGVIVQWTAKSTSGSKDVDTHLIIENKETGQKHEIGYNKHISLNKQYRYGIGTDLCAFSVYLDRDDTQAGAGETILIEPFSSKYNYYFILYAFRGNEFVNCPIDFTIFIHKSLETGIKQDQFLTLNPEPLETAKRFYRALAVKDGVISVINEFTDDNSGIYEIETSSTHTNCEPI